MIKHHFLKVVCVSIAVSMAALVPSAFCQCSPDDPNILCYDVGVPDRISVRQLNESGQVVGDLPTSTGTFQAFLWTRSGGMVDLGTLGGSYSHAMQINESGRVMGSSEMPTGVYHAFLWTQTDGMVDLGTLGGSWTWERQINEACQIIGRSETAAGEVHGFLWTQADGMVDLGTLGGSSSYAAQINNAGQIVGYSDVSVDAFHAFLWTQAGGMVDIGTLGRNSSWAYLINEAGQVAGSDLFGHAFLWTQAGGMEDLGTLGGSWSTPVQMNESGEVVGNSITDSSERRAFFWSRSIGIVDLGTLGGIFSEAAHINEAGQIVGNSSTASGEVHAFLWTQAGGMVDLSTLGGSFSSVVQMNEAGQVVGISSTGTGESHAFLWTEDSGMVDLGTLNGIRSEPVDINNAGQILGYDHGTAIGPRGIVWCLPPFLDKATLYFNGTAGSGFATRSQTVRVDGRGTTTDKWTVTTDQPWLHVSPAGGAGNGSFTVSWDPASSPPPSWDGTIKVSWPGNINRIVRVYGKVLRTGESRPPFGYFDTPVNGATGITGAIPVTGWALDDIEVTAVKIWRAPVAGEGRSLIYLGDAVFVEGNRPDVAAAFSTSPFNYRAGWGYMVLTNYLPNRGNGRYKLYAYASDMEGHRILLGTKAITCNNVNATMPFGTIDTPAQGETVSGSFRNWGWALTPQPSMIPEDGSTIEVWVDGSRVTSGVSVGLTRPDIQALFPGYNNTDTAVHYFDLDTTVYENGLHNIAWGVEDDAGHVSGIGSRFFWIEN